MGFHGCYRSWPTYSGRRLLIFCSLIFRSEFPTDGLRWGLRIWYLLWIKKKPVRQVNATHLVNALCSSWPVPKVSHVLYSNSTSKDMWLICGLARPGGTIRLQGPFLLFFPCLQLITFLLPRRTQESGALFTSCPFFFKCCVHLTSQGRSLLKTKFSFLTLGLWGIYSK